MRHSTQAPDTRGWSIYDPFARDPSITSRTSHDVESASFHSLLSETRPFTERISHTLFLKYPSVFTFFQVLSLPTARTNLQIVKCHQNYVLSRWVLTELIFSHLQPCKVRYCTVDSISVLKFTLLHTKVTNAPTWAVTFFCSLKKNFTFLLFPSLLFCSFYFNCVTKRPHSVSTFFSALTATAAQNNTKPKFTVTSFSPPSRLQDAKIEPNCCLDLSQSSSPSLKSSL